MPACPSSRPFRLILLGAGMLSAFPVFGVDDEHVRPVVAPVAPSHAAAPPSPGLQTSKLSPGPLQTSTAPAGTAIGPTPAEAWRLVFPLKR